MRGTCGKCGRTFDGQMLCPRCGIGLLDEGEGTTLPRPLPTPDELADGPSFVRRCALGGIALVGLFHGLKHLALAALLAQTGEANLSGQGVLSLLVIAILGAAIVAGTVNRRAEVTGFVLGAGAAGGLMGQDVLSGDQAPYEWFLGVPALLMLLGVAGGFAGRLIMPPAPALPRFGRHDVPDRIKVRRPERLSWINLVAGACLAVAGTVYADELRTILSRALTGHGGSFAASRLVTWQITVVAAVAGGFAAGANTPRGVAQGFVAGLFAAVGVVAATAVMGPSESLVVEFWLDQLGQDEIGPVTFAAVGGTAWLGTAVGGWLGGQLLPGRRGR